MTASTVTAPVSKTGTWPERLHQAGLRVTTPRLLTLSVLTEYEHATAQQIQERLSDRGLAPDPSTIYRALEILTEHGLVTHVHLDGVRPSYQLADRGGRAHLICRHCGAITELSEVTTGILAEGVRDVHDFVVDVSHLGILGICADCLNRSTG